MVHTSYSLLREAYSIIDGVPDEVINLDLWSQHELDLEHPCNTLACAGGLLAQHPKMIARGFRLESVRKTHYKTTANDQFPAYEGQAGYRAIANFFHLSYQEVEQLFGDRSSAWKYDPPLPRRRAMSDRQLWLYRVRKFLEEDAAFL